MNIHQLSSFQCWSMCFLDFPWKVIVTWWFFVPAWVTLKLSKGVFSYNFGMEHLMVQFVFNEHQWMFIKFHLFSDYLTRQVETLERQIGSSVKPTPPLKDEKPPPKGSTTQPPPTGDATHGCKSSPPWQLPTPPLDPKEACTWQWQTWLFW